ncbi:tryptophan--tRNA ligase [Buchnera aphidicola (Formosaphis micheliae)]|uniref:tryptophan--tRNA ligase n=1 Tax=Buchnera aphidicola TaxID=9 RepID=UPI0031CCB0AF
MKKNKSILFSAIQPTGQLTLGNYLGTLCHWDKIQEEYNSIYCIADLHALTTCRDHSSLQINIFDTLALYLSCGVDPKKSIIFVQSHVYEHAQLNWILNCYAYCGELMRMTQFKSKSKECHNNNVNIGLLNYPILMASDILLYQTKKVLVGSDQKQHLELASKIAMRFNKIYKKNIFTIPEILLSQSGSKIMSLLEPDKKMSKSNVNTKNTIFLLEDIQCIKNKIKCAVTDSNNSSKIYYNVLEKPGISNLMTIFSGITGKSITELEIEFSNVMYSKFKDELSDVLSIKIKQIQKSYCRYRKDEVYLKDIVVKGAEKAREYAQKTLRRVYKLLYLN